jgi:Na+-transporting methylmalonyl-CoA/oxaloacetate decarboxylase beta subunit
MKKFGLGMIALSIIIFITGVSMKIKQRAAIGIIGGADRPTSVFIAGKVPEGLGIMGILCGILLLGAGLYLIFRKNRNK